MTCVQLPLTLNLAVCKSVGYLSHQPGGKKIMKKYFLVAATIGAIVLFSPQASQTRPNLKTELWEGQMKPLLKRSLCGYSGKFTKMFHISSLPGIPRLNI